MSGSLINKDERAKASCFLMERSFYGTQKIGLDHRIMEESPLSMEQVGKIYSLNLVSLREDDLSFTQTSSHWTQGQSKLFESICQRQESRGSLEPSKQICSKMTQSCGQENSPSRWSHQHLETQ